MLKPLMTGIAPQVVPFQAWPAGQAQVLPFQVWPPEQMLAQLEPFQAVPALQAAWQVP